MGEKDVADAFISTDNRFLPFVDADRRYVEGCIALTIAQRACKPVCMAFPGTEITIMQFEKRIRDRHKIHGLMQFLRNFEGSLTNTKVRFS
jgi:hypothetical protein